MSRIPTILALSLLALGPAPLTARPQPPRAWVRLADRLQLSPEQRTQIQAVRQRHRTAATPKLEAAALAREAFRAAARKPEATPAQLRALHQAKADKEFELLLERRSLAADIRALLTPEQRVQWDQERAYRRARRDFDGGHRKRGGAMG